MMMKYSSAKLDEPIYINSQSKYIWQITFSVESHHVTNFEIFCVVSDKCDNIGKCPWSNLIDLYALSCDGGNVWNGTTSSFQSDPTHTARIKMGDIITMELDCKQSTLSYKLGDNEFFKQILPPRQAWYPAVALGFYEWSASAKFIPYKIQ